MVGRRGVKKSKNNAKGSGDADLGLLGTFKAAVLVVGAVGVLGEVGVFEEFGVEGDAADAAEEFGLAAEQLDELDEKDKVTVVVTVVVVAVAAVGAVATAVAAVTFVAVKLAIPVASCKVPVSDPADELELAAAVALIALAALFS